MTRSRIFALALFIVGTVSQAQQAGDGEAAPIYGLKLSAGYRDWTLISVARVGSPLNDMRAKLGNRTPVPAAAGAW